MSRGTYTKIESEIHNITPPNLVLSSKILKTNKQNFFDGIK